MKEIKREDILNMPTYTLDKASYITTPNGAYVFTGTEFKELSEPKVEQVFNSEVKVGTMHSGMTIKDVARHKDVVKLQQRVMELEVAMSNLVNGKDFSIGQETYWKESE